MKIAKQLLAFSAAALLLAGCSGTDDLFTPLSQQTVPKQSGTFEYNGVSGKYVLTCVNRRVDLTVTATDSQQQGNKFRLTASAPTYGSVTSEVLKKDMPQTVTLPDGPRGAAPPGWRR